MKKTTKNIQRNIHFTPYKFRSISNEIFPYECHRDVPIYHQVTKVLFNCSTKIRTHIFFTQASDVVTRPQVWKTKNDVRFFHHLNNFRAARSQFCRKRRYLEKSIFGKVDRRWKKSKSMLASASKRRTNCCIRRLAEKKCPVFSDPLRSD